MRVFDLRDQVISRTVGGTGKDCMMAAAGWAAKTACSHFALESKLVNFFCKVPDNIDVRLYGTEGSVATAQLCHCSAQGAINHL